MLENTIQSQPYNPRLVLSIKELQTVRRIQAELQEIREIAQRHGQENLFSRDYSKPGSQGDGRTSSVEGMSSKRNLALVNSVMVNGVQDTRDSLCQGVHLGDVDTLHCLSLHRGDPYLRLGPFKLEVAAKEPFIGVLRNLHSSRQMQEVSGGGREWSEHLSRCVIMLEGV